MRKGKWFWIARDKTPVLITDVCLFYGTKPKLDIDGCYVVGSGGDDNFVSFTNKKFKKIFNITIKLGQCLKVRLEVCNGKR